MNIKRWLLCAFLFLICFVFLHWLNNYNVVESNQESDSNRRGNNGKTGYTR